MKTSPRLLLTGLIPGQFRLPVKFAWQRLRSLLEPELVFLLKQGKKNGTAVDVGANGGIYSYALARIFDRVEAFEPNRSAATGLNYLSSKKIVVHNEALSDRAGEAILYTPVSASGVEYAGWGSLHRDTLPAAKAIRTRTVMTRTLDSYGFDSVALIKIDVETHEHQVLNGAIDTIERCRPTFLIEVKPPARAEVWDFFSRWQYRCFFLERNRLCSVTLMADFAANSGENFFWLPAESGRISQTPGVASVNQTSSWPSE